jgi:small subunit ribosomal protein S6
MRHYEIVVLIHPDQSDQAPAMIKRYKEIIGETNGQVHRLEDWGRRQLAYPINKIHKAHYLLMNIECTKTALDELNSLFRYNDAVIRNLIIKRDTAITSPSPIMIEMAAAKKADAAAAKDTHKASAYKADPGKASAAEKPPADAETKEVKNEEE